MIEDYGTTVLVATPSYAMHMCEVGEQHGLRLGDVHAARGPVRRRAVPAGPQGRDRGAACTSCAPTTTASPRSWGRACPASALAARDHAAHRRGPLPVGGGRSGNRRAGGARARWASSCSRRLDKQAIPVLRYRTHDLTARASREPCACGRTTARMQKVRARSDDMLIIRGTNVFPSQVEDVLAGHRGRHAALPHRRGDRGRPRPHDRARGAQARGVLATPTRTWTRSALAIAEKLKGVLLVGVRGEASSSPAASSARAGKAKHVDDRREK